jgi:hypothetical protein
MPQSPTQPKIYHIVHLDRLGSIVRDGCLWSDAIIIKRRDAGTTIGMGAIKERRLRLPVACHSGTYVGNMYRSISVRDRSCCMLFIVRIMPS